ncbi:hypothetical protein Y1Q_0000109 [Alligator mississippiensis]|uniref:Uncharacterized protein n=1 Tax=Alligator mississippiensis TaxID=8496 RepID=A0A151NQH5_ALLMI|nr:hypothetical protein Y1Q_0000109 [Alligator mississippiensis]
MAAAVVTATTAAVAMATAPCPGPDLAHDETHNPECKGRKEQHISQRTKEEYDCELNDNVSEYSITGIHCNG